MNDDEKARLIAAQNDSFRANFFNPHFGLRKVPGRFLCTRGLSALPAEAQITVWFAVANFDGFDEGNDPHGERNFGALEVEGVSERVFWKIDYYADKTCEEGSADPSDLALCFRVLTLMLASEY